MLKTKTFLTVRSSSVVHDGNLHTTWFCSIRLFPTGTVSQSNNVLACLGLVSCQQLAGPLLFSSKKWFSPCLLCPMCRRGLHVFLLLLQLFSFSPILSLDNSTNLDLNFPQITAVISGHYLPLANWGYLWPIHLVQISTVILARI